MTHSKTLTQKVSNGYGLSHKPLLESIMKYLSGNADQPLDELNVELAGHTTEVVSALYASWETNKWTIPSLDISSNWGVW
jgi:hypothetical protein